MLALSNAMVARIEAELASEPLKPGEFRRVAGMGRLHLSLVEEPEAPPEFDYLYALTIAGTRYSFYAAYPQPLPGQPQTD